MKEYKDPEIEMVSIEVEDVITTSITVPGANGNEGGAGDED